MFSTHQEDVGVHGCLIGFHVQREIQNCDGQCGNPKSTDQIRITIQLQGFVYGLCEVSLVRASVVWQALRCVPLQALFSCTHCGLGCDRILLLVPLLPLPELGRRCDSLLSLLACAGGGIVCDRFGLLLPLLHLPSQLRRCDLLLNLLTCIHGGTVCDCIGPYAPLLRLRLQLESRHFSHTLSATLYVIAGSFKCHSCISRGRRFATIHRWSFSHSFAAALYVIASNYMCRCCISRSWAGVDAVIRCWPFSHAPVVATYVIALGFLRHCCNFQAMSSL